METSTLSKHSSVGFSRSLLQVNHRQCRCRSCSSSIATVRLKRLKLALLICSLFLSASLRMRLKSPVTAHGPGQVSLIASNSSRRMILSPSSYGPYTEVSHQLLDVPSSWAADTTETVIEKQPTSTSTKATSDWRPAMSMPPQVFDAGR